ncbi:MAG: hypothetical protein A2Y91_00280 [Chloroflexi bacterium RBG_13_54_8]|nr:MAG: hypothetical protein A2Y91_00280 [Chloroflexi bacterium RBG_13_54_8]
MPVGEKPKVRPVMQCTSVFTRNAIAYRDGKRRALNQGGVSSSKTFSILQLLIMIAASAKKHTLISVVSESLPHLKRGAMRDFFTIMDESQDSNPRWSKTEFTYHFPVADIEFFGADDEGKVRGPRRQILFINEANNVPWETARGLDIRSESFTFIDWNPTGEFWVNAYEDSEGRLIPGWIEEPSSELIKSTYLDAHVDGKSVLPASVVANIESQRDKDPNWWNIYGLGELGKIEGRVYPSFQQIDELPDGRAFYGLDFGFSGDPAVLTKHVIVGANLYSQELIYQRGLTNDQIAREMDLAKVSKSDPVLADAAEPKSIEEIRQKGFNILATEKGKGSVEYGIQKVNQFYQFWTKDSLNCIKEQRNFRYIKDNDGRFTDRTTHEWSHGMDSRRYALAGHRMSAPKDRNWRVSTSIRR